MTTVLAGDSAYSGFVRAYDGMAFLTDPTARFRAAIAAVQAHGATPVAIVQAIELHEAVLHTQEQQFKETMATQIVEQVDNRKRDADAAAQQLTTLRQQAEQLQQQIQAKLEEIRMLNQDVEIAKARIDAVHAGFTTAVATVATRLREDKTRLSQQ